MDLELSADQKKALTILTEWGIKPKTGYITLGGYAGTGKTTLIAKLRQEWKKKNSHLKVAFASYTGKASRVLNNKLKENEAIFSQDSIGTIHSLIYSPLVNNKEEIVGWKRKDELEKNIIVIDEASMVDEIIWRDLISYGVPIVAVGDHGQLPPIRGAFNLMANPELKLNQIHRQAENNPIIKLSIMARENGKIKVGRHGDGVVKIDRNDSWAQEEAAELLRGYNEETLVLCGYNQTRIKLNHYIRQSRGLELARPLRGDRVICLRNNHSKGIFNGMIGTIKEIGSSDPKWWRARVEMDGEEKVYDGLMMANQFNQKEAMNFTGQRRATLPGDLFDFGYALTVHKAQGSQARRVILFEERFSQMSETDWRRWLYTGITRAEEELYLIGN